MPDTTVKYFDSTMTGAPTLSGTAGALLGVLDACLKDGFGTVTLDSLVVTDNVATATKSAGHSFTMYGSSATGPVIRIAGATPSGLNGDWRLASVPGSTTFTFATTGISNQTATGTITATRAPCGWSKAYSGTNKSAYRADDVASTRLYLRLDDTGTYSARGVGYETMSDIDTGDGPFPTSSQQSGGFYWPKSNAASSSARAWRLYGDGRGFFYCADNYGNSSWYTTAWFGDILTFKAADAYHCVHVAGNSDYNGYFLSGLSQNTATYGVIARNYTQLTDGRSVVSVRRSHSKSSTGMGYAGAAYPSVVDSTILIAPVDVWDADTVLRGIMPGLYDPVHAQNPPDGTLIDSWAALPGRVLQTQAAVTGSWRLVIDLTGPWR